MCKLESRPSGPHTSATTEKLKITSGTEDAETHGLREIHKVLEEDRDGTQKPEIAVKHKQSRSKGQSSSSPEVFYFSSECEGIVVI